MCANTPLSPKYIKKYRSKLQKSMCYNPIYISKNWGMCKYSSMLIAEIFWKDSQEPGKTG